MLPIELGHRPMRTGMLAAELGRRGHHVTWWTSAFSHQHRRLLAERDTIAPVNDRLELRMLHGGTYAATVSLARHRHNARVSRRFAALAPSLPRPDVILASYPIIELADEAVRYARRSGVPVLVDVRDYWPDLFLERLPGGCRPFARLALGSTFQRARRTLASADSLLGISEGILRFALGHAGRGRRDADRVFPIGCRAAPASGERQAAVRSPRLPADSAAAICTFIGTFGSSYDLETVLRAAALLLQTNGPSVRIVLAGGGDKSAAISRAAARLPNVTLTGWLSGVEVEALLAQTNIGLMPLVSRPDSMPNKFFEYLRAGVPIVSSLEGEVEQLIQERGLGVSYRSGDEAGLARALTELATAPESMVAMGRRSRGLFEERYAAEMIYPEYADHIESVARRTITTSTVTLVA